MHILLDGRLCNKSHGIGRYTYELINGLSKQDIKLSVILNNKDCLKEFENFENIEKIFTNIPPFSLINQIILPKIVQNIKPDIFHVPHFAAPINQPIKTVITIHDLIHLKFIKDYSIFHYFYYNFFVKNALKKASYVITISENSKNDIINWVSFVKDKIDVIYLGIDFNHFYPRVVQNKEPYILYIGNYKSHKNIKLLLNAFAILCKEHTFNQSLVLGGKIPKYVKELIFYYGLLKRVKVIGDIPEEELPVLYSNATLLVFPSLYEGFGLPPLEALACGVPVVCSKISILTEILKDNAYYFYPLTPFHLAKAIDTILKDKNLYHSFKQRGLNYVKIYSWESTIKSTLDIYKKVIGD